MIVTLLVYFLVAFISILLSLLPIAPDIPEAAEAWVGYFSAGISFIDFLLPVEQLGILIGLWLFIEGILLIYKASITIYRWIRG